MIVQLTFKINDDAKLYFETVNEADQKDFYLDELVLIVLEYRTKRYILNFDCICSTFKIFISFLEKIVNKELLLDPTIKENLGYLNEKFLDGTIKKPWIGYKYSLFDPPGYAIPEVSTWFYNNPNNTVIFEITETYPWRDYKPEFGEKVLPYEKFMERYDSILVFTLPLQKVRTWLKKAKKAKKLLYVDAQVPEPKDCC